MFAQRRSHPDTYSIYADDQGGAKKEEFPDLLHPNAAGYAKWTQALEGIFQTLSLGKSAD
jgi:lysophospholipase L1-like esterase